MSAPLIPDLPLWERHEQRVLAILRAALHLLRTEEPEGHEPKLNRSLYKCVLKVNRDNYTSGGPSFCSSPIMDGPNPPTPDTADSPSERKKPDLSWRYIDHQEPDPLRSVRSFTIECKRLGSPSTSGWKFNVRYARDGVRRFTDPDFGYGRDAASGSMVGYVESLTLEEIVAEVNGELPQLGVPDLDLPSQADGSLTEMEHSFTRPFPISPFRLIHLWIDIRPIS